MKISFGILVHNEDKSLEKLLKQLFDDTPKKNYNYEVVIVDDYSTNFSTQKILELFKQKYRKKIRIYKRQLNNNFASQKNFLNNKCTGDYIVNIDADELLPTYIIENIHEIIKESNAELMWVPRLNYVDGITEKHIQEWGWKLFSDIAKIVPEIKEKIININSEEYQLLKKNNLVVILNEELDDNIKIKYYIPVINFPDIQGRIYKRVPDRIKWKNKVHEVIRGYKSYTILPTNVEMAEHICIKHLKTIEKQEKQNAKYFKIIK